MAAMGHSSGMTLDSPLPRAQQDEPQGSAYGMQGTEPLSSPGKTPMHDLGCIYHYSTQPSYFLVLPTLPSPPPPPPPPLISSDEIILSDAHNSKQTSTHLLGHHTEIILTEACSSKQSLAAIGGENQSTSQETMQPEVSTSCMYPKNQYLHEIAKTFLPGHVSNVIQRLDSYCRTRSDETTPSPASRKSSMKNHALYSVSTTPRAINMPTDFEGCAVSIC